QRGWQKKLFANQSTSPFATVLPFAFCIPSTMIPIGPACFCNRDISPDQLAVLVGVSLLLAILLVGLPVWIIIWWIERQKKARKSTRDGDKGGAQSGVLVRIQRKSCISAQMLLLIPGVLVWNGS